LSVTVKLAGGRGEEWSPRLGGIFASAPRRLHVHPSRALLTAHLVRPCLGQLIGGIDHLEHDRGNSAQTENALLAAIHSMFRPAAWPTTGPARLWSTGACKHCPSDRPEVAGQLPLPKPGR